MGRGKLLHYILAVEDFFIRRLLACRAFSSVEAFRRHAELARPQKGGDVVKFSVFLGKVQQGPGDVADIDAGL